MNQDQLVKQQGGGYQNVYPLTYIQSIVDAESNEKLSDILVKYNHLYLNWQGSQENTRLSIPILIRKHGLWISYDMNGTLYTEWFKGNNITSLIDNVWKDSTNWERIPDLKFVEDASQRIPTGAILPEMLSPALQQLLAKQHNITNWVDDEDLESKCNVIRLKDKEYNPYTASGLGRKRLRKNWVKGRNLLTQEMINQSNTIYEIQYDYDLNGSTITIPDGCTLDFKGGSLRNGKVSGIKTKISTKNSLIFNNIDIDGSFVNDTVYDYWFERMDFYDIMSRLITLSNPDVMSIINISRDYFFSKDKPYFTITSNKTIDGNGHKVICEAIPLDKGSNLSRIVIEGNATENISIKNLNLESDYPYFDTGTFKGQTSNSICMHFLNVHNCVLENISFKGFNNELKFSRQSASDVYFNSNIRIKNCSFIESKTPLSIFSCDNVVVSNCFFDSVLSQNVYDHNIYVDNSNNINIENCAFSDSLGAGIHIFSAKKLLSNNIYINNCNFKDTKTCIVNQFSSNVKIDNIQLVLSDDFINKLNILTSDKNIVIVNMYNTNNSFINRALSENIKFSSICFKTTYCNNTNITNSYFKSTNKGYALMYCEDKSGDIKMSNVDFIFDGSVEDVSSRIILANQLSDVSIQADRCSFNINSIDSFSSRHFFSLNSNIASYFKNCNFYCNGASGVISYPCKNTSFINNLLSDGIKGLVANYDITIKNINNKYTNNSNVDIPSSGLFSSRPDELKGVNIGESYFCTDRKSIESEVNGMVIYYKGNNVWVDALGRTIT